MGEAQKEIIVFPKKIDFYQILCNRVVCKNL